MQFRQLFEEASQGEHYFPKEIKYFPKGHSSTQAVIDNTYGKIHSRHIQST
jgi:hypothetical protein